MMHAASRLVASSRPSTLMMLPRAGGEGDTSPPSCSAAKAWYLSSSMRLMCTARPPRRRPVTANTAATIRNRLCPTVRPSLPVEGPREPPARLPRGRGVTPAPAPLPLPARVRRGVFVPRASLTFPALGRSTRRSSPFLFSPAPCPILPFSPVELQIFATWCSHTQFLGRERSDPLCSGQLRDPYFKARPFCPGSVEIAFELCDPPFEAGGDRVRVDAPQHQQHRHHHQHGELTPPNHVSRLPVRTSLAYRPCRLRRERGQVPALRRGHQAPPPAGSAVLVAARSRAEALRGFSSNSRSDGLRTTPRRKTGRAPHTQTGSSGGQTQRPSRSVMNRLTRRSSPEWKVMTTSLPPAERRCSEASSA